MDPDFEKFKHLMASLFVKATELAEVKRELAACKAALMDDRREQADAIVRAMAEEAANLRPVFNSEEQACIRFALGAIRKDLSSRVGPGHNSMETIASILDKLSTMAAVGTDPIPGLSDG